MNWQARSLFNRNSPFSILARFVLLLFVLIAFTRLIWRLDANNLWWDESLSLLRAESDWRTLLVGRINLFDGIYTTPTIDQHPFGFFVILGWFVRLAGKSEFVLRFPSLMMSTLLVPTLWAMGRYAERHQFLPAGSAVIAALLAACNPFYLYYGQEARMYTLLALLAVLTVYLLLRWHETAEVKKQQQFLLGYGVTTLFFLTTHYFAILLLPFHALIFYLKFYSHNRRLALIVASALLLVGLVMGLAAAWIILSQPMSGYNFRPISLSILVPDLLNAFSLGLSVDIEHVWWLDLVFGAVALIGLGWGIRCRRAIQGGGWLLPMAIISPIGLLLVINLVQPAYMNARHLALISSFFLLLVAGGIVVAWRWHRLLGGGIVVLFLSGMIYSTANHYTVPAYGKDDFAALGKYLQSELAPGDLLLIYPPELLRLYQYYLPMGTIERARKAGVTIGWQGIPLLAPPGKTVPVLPSLLEDYERIWVVHSGMFPSFSDPGGEIEAWINSHLFRIRYREFSSTSSFLKLILYLPKPPVAVSPPADMIEVNTIFGDQIHLLGYRIGQPLTAESEIPVTFYWQAMKPLEAHYKYIAYLEVFEADGAARRLPMTEREPYDGFLPTPLWPPNQVISERTDVAGPLPATEIVNATLVLRIYEAESLEKVPIRSTEAGTIDAEGNGLKFTFPIPHPNLP